MKTMNKKVKYESPQTDSIDILAEGILCASGEKEGIFVDPMDVINGGAGSDWDWE